MNQKTAAAVTFKPRFENDILFMLSVQGFSAKSFSVMTNDFGHFGADKLLAGNFTTEETCLQKHYNVLC